MKWKKKRKEIIRENKREKEKKKKIRIKNGNDRNDHAINYFS